MRKNRIFYLFAIMVFVVNVSFGKISRQDISVNFQEVPLRSALRWLTKFSDRNVVISNLVQGNVTLHLKKIFWKDALSIILRSHNLAEKEVGRVFYIAPLAEFVAYEKKQKEAEDNLPTEEMLIKLNYADVKEVAKLLQNKGQNLLSAKGRVMVDVRTNSLMIQDNEQKLAAVKKFIKQLDTPIPQVLIAAYIVNIDESYEKDIGVRFGVTSGHHLSGSLNAANQLAGGTNAAQVKVDDRLNVDLPAVSSGAGKLGVALFKLSRGTLLDLELSALETEGRAEIISNPKLMTANRQTASIESGEEIPYQESAAEGVSTTAFKEAVLRLQVTPQITPDNKIILHLKVNQDKRSSKEVKGVPAIDTRQINTQVTMNDGQTVVLGGIYEQIKTNNVEKVPFFSELPIIGALFRHKKNINDRRELLIFVTPKIVKL
jgi:type IV pilus assembly protein PilQ